MTRRSILRDLTGWLGLRLLGATIAVIAWLCQSDDPDRMSGREFAGCWLVAAAAAAVMILWLCVGG